jgi:hypothetical protein
LNEIVVTLKIAAAFDGHLRRSMGWLITPLIIYAMATTLRDVCASSLTHRQDDAVSIATPIEDFQMPEEAVGSYIPGSLIRNS